MPDALLKAIPGVGKVFGLGDYIFAAVSGVIDGATLRKAPLIFLLKNLAIPVAGFAGIPVPHGLMVHSVGQLGMIATLLVVR